VAIAHERSDAPRLPGDAADPPSMDGVGREVCSLASIAVHRAANSTIRFGEPMPVGGLQTVGVRKKGRGRTCNVSDHTSGGLRTGVILLNLSSISRSNVSIRLFRALNLSSSRMAIQNTAPKRKTHKIQSGIRQPHVHRDASAPSPSSG
jgi:hypothetical protein